MDIVVKKILDLFPTRKLRLPLLGNRQDWPYHITMCNPGFREVWERLSYYNMVSSLVMIYKTNALIPTYGLIDKTLRTLFSLNFFGLNTMRYQGFTEYKDNRLSSYTDQLKHVLNPNEYVLWDEPVYSMTDGTVVKIYNDSLDMISRDALNSRPVFGDEVNKLYGNNIMIETDKGIQVLYSGLRRNSFLRFKMGDMVKAGQEIGRVGCSGSFAKRPFLHIEFAFKFIPNSNIETVQNLQLNNFPVPAVNFESFYEMPLWTDYRDTAEGIERMYVKDIKYIFNPGHFLRAGSLIKRTTNK